MPFLWPCLVFWKNGSFINPLMACWVTPGIVIYFQLMALDIFVIVNYNSLLNALENTPWTCNVSRAYMSHLVTKPTMWLCAQRRLRSAWVSAESDQSLRLRLMGSLGSKLSSGGQRRLWSDWADAQADPSLRSAHTHFVGFVTRRLIFCPGYYLRNDHFHKVYQMC